jgi:hypothetical protein
MGNLPKREGHLLQSEPQRIFWLRTASCVGVAAMRQCNEAQPEDGLRRGWGEVSLDGAENKSEDCRVDAGTYVAEATTIALN